MPVCCVVCFGAVGGVCCTCSLFRQVIGNALCVRGGEGAALMAFGQVASAPVLIVNGSGFAIEVPQVIADRDLDEVAPMGFG